MARQRVVITGVGCVTPLGTNLQTVWSRLVEGHSGVGPLTRFNARDFPVQIAAEVRDWDISQVGEDPQRWQHHPRQTQFAVASAIDAVRDAHLLDAPLDPLRFGVYLGCGETFPDFDQFASLIQNSLDGDRFCPEKFAAASLGTSQPQVATALQMNVAPSCLAALFNAQGPNFNCIAACASSGQAIGEATEIIRRGDADVMLAGGAHSMIHPFGITGLHRLSALSTSSADPPCSPRPFDRARDGFVVGEGGAILVLESLQHAKRRGAEIWAEVTGYGSAQDAFRITDTHPEGRGAIRCMNGALADARLNVDQIDYVNAHGTGTILNDRMETLAIKRVFGHQASRLPVSSTKSMLGHFTTASSAIELLVCLMTLHSGVVPPTINYSTPDPDCDLDCIPNTARQVPCRHVLSNSFGFGGQNAALIVSHCDEVSRYRQVAA